MDAPRNPSRPDPAVPPPAGPGPNAAEDDEQLLAGLHRGDRAAAEAVVRRYWGAIHRFAHSYLQDSGLAEDVAQETFARLSDGSNLPTGPLKPWLYRVARNRCLDILRHHQRSPTHHHQLRTGVDTPADTAGPRTRAVRDEKLSQVRAVIEGLPEEYKSVLMLKYVEGLSRTEIAEALEITEAAVKGRLARGSDVLQEELRRLTGLGGGTTS